MRRISLGEIFNDNELNTIYYNSQGRDADYWNASNLVSGGEGNGERLPNLALYGIIVVGYLVIVGPGIICPPEKARAEPVLRNRGICFLFGSLRCDLGNGFLRQDLPANSVQRRRSSTHQEPVQRRMTFLNIRTPDSSGFTVDLPSDYKVTPLTRSGRYDTNQIEDYRKKTSDRHWDPERGRSDRALEQKVKKPLIPDFSSSSGRGTRCRETWMRIFTVSDGTITGYVENTLPVTLENAAVYLYGQVLILGDLEPGGQRLEFDREPLKVWPVGMTWMLSDALTGTPDRQEDSDGQYIEKCPEIRTRCILCEPLLCLLQR